MTDSVCTGSVVVDGEVASGGVDLAGFPEQPVVPDAGGEGEYSLANACPDALGDVAAVVLEGELALERVVDRLDPLADPAELAEAWLLVLAVGADELRIERGDDPLELLAGEALVGDDDLLAGEQPFAARLLEHRCRDLALALVRWRQAEGDRHPLGRAEQVQPQTPEVARVRSAVAVSRPARELGALDGLPGGPAGHRGGVQQPQPLAERRRDPGQMPDRQADLRSEGSQALVVARLLGDIGEQVRKPPAGEAQKPTLGRAMQEHLSDRERNELG